MPEWKDIPLFGSAYRNIDEIELPELNPLVRNCYVNEANHLVQRPGLQAFINLGISAPIDALYWWEEAQLGIIVADGKVYRITDVNGSTTQYTGSVTINKNRPMTFASDGTNLYLGHGSNIIHWTATGNLTQMADPDAPTQVSHVAFLDQYILANVSSTAAQFQISEVGDGLSWRAVDSFTAESGPDKLRALHSALGEIVLLGTDTVEYWANDGVSPFSVIKGATLPVGAAAGHTFVEFNRNLLWFSNQRRLLLTEPGKRNPTEVSLPMNREFDSLSDVSDAHGFIANIDGLPLYVLTFPTDDRTFVYNIDKKEFIEWDYFDNINAVSHRWLGNTYMYARSYNQYLVGSRLSNGVVYKASRNINTDDGDPIHVVIRSGFIDYNTSTTKVSYKLRLKLKRSAGDGVNNITPKFKLRFRNNPGAWSNWRQGSLGSVGDYEMFVDFNQLGEYRARQWELEKSDDSHFILAGARELVEILPT